MPPSRRDRDAAAIRDMLSAMREAEMHIIGLSKEAAGSSPHPRDAALYRILVLGEAAKRVSTELQSAHPGVPWADIIGMRNTLIHGYEKVDWDTVWTTIHHDFPVVSQQLTQILATLQ